MRPIAQELANMIQADADWDATYSKVEEAEKEHIAAQSRRTHYLDELCKAVNFQPKSIVHFITADGRMFQLDNRDGHYPGMFSEITPTKTVRIGGNPLPPQHDLGGEG